MLSAFTRLVLVNAIYFKGDWATKFNPKATSKRDFRLADSSIKKVSTMFQSRQFSIASLEPLDAIMLELPYKGDRLVLQVVLPSRGTTLAALEAKLKTEDLEKLWVASKGEQEVEVNLPKFKLEQTIPLTEQLQKLGMTDMFSDMADFSGC